MKKILLFLIIALAFTSCNSPTNNPDDDPTENPEAALVEVDIGSSGGIIEAEGITLTVPPESFSSLATIRIYAGEESMNAFGDNRVTDLFLIEGIPEDFSEPIKVAIEYSGSLANENFLAVGNELELIESEEPSYSTALFEARDSSGYLISSIEPPALSSSDASIKKGTSSIYSKALLMGLSNMTSIKTPYFRLSHQFQADRPKIIKLAEYMDAAIDTFANLNLIDKSLAESAIKLFGKVKVSIWGRNNERYRGWCIEMPEFEMYSGTEMPPPSYGAMIWESLLSIKVSMSENVLRLSNEKEIAALAFGWVYRICCFSKVGSHQDWFTYGSTLWMKEKYSGVEEYKVTTSPDFAMSPLMGMESGKSVFNDVRKAQTAFGGILTVEEGNYGHSMIPFIKYLDLAYGQDKKLISRVLIETLHAPSKTPSEGIINAIEDPEYIWFPGFYKAYFTRELYNISYEHFRDKIHSLDQLNFYEELDTTLYRDESYADLSARLYSVNFLMSEFKQDVILNLKLGPSSLNLNYVTAMAFGLKDGELEYFDHAADLTITKLADLKDNGYNSIVALVVNSANEPPFNESLKIELDAKLRIAPKDFDWVIFKVKARTTYNYTDGASSEGSYIYADAELRTGEMEGNTFTATWSEPFSDGTSSGTIDIVFDPDRFPHYITSYSVTETRKLSDTRTYTITGENIELYGYKDYTGAYSYYVSGVEAKDYISSIDEVYSGSEGYGYSTDGTPITDDKSYIEIRMGTFE